MMFWKKRPSVKKWAKQLEDIEGQIRAIDRRLAVLMYRMEQELAHYTDEELENLRV